MPLVDLTGAYDIHIHSNPSRFKRVGSDLDIAQHASENGLAGIILKNHFESTVGRADLVNRLTESTSVFGGLVLNRFAGGINPYAVENALAMGAKEIWMPTMDAEGHMKVYGKSAGYGYQEVDIKIPRQGIGILTKDAHLLDPVMTVVELVKEYGAILGTGHLSDDEILQLALFSKEIGFKGLLVTHPYFNPPKLSVDSQRDLVELGCFLELCGGNLYPIPGTARLDDYLATIEKVGCSSLVISSDAGQPRKSMPAEVLRIFTQCLMEKGISQGQIDTMTKDNPARLLGV